MTSSEKGQIEKANEMIRRHLPKTTNFKHISQEELDVVTERINNRPMRLLGFRTPNEVFGEKVRRWYESGESDLVGVWVCKVLTLYLKLYKCTVTHFNI
jgi:hypothetical protein